jgi:DNA-binding NarL/FixJ family response regulator
MEKDKQTVRLLIVDDHQMIRDGIRVMLELQSKSYKFIITEAEDGEDAVKKILHHHFDIILIDYQLPKMTGVQTIEKILLYQPEAKILALSNYDEVSYVTNMLNAGAKGYILKNIEPAQLISAIKTVLNNKIFYSNEIAIKLLESERTKSRPPVRNKFGLTERELLILKMIAQELNNEEIAKSLNIAKRTVDAHRQNLLHKLDAKNTVGLVKAAFELKLI